MSLGYDITLFYPGKSSNVYQGILKNWVIYENLFNLVGAVGVEVCKGAADDEFADTVTPVVIVKPKYRAFRFELTAPIT